MATVESDKPVALFTLLGLVGASLFVQQAFGSTKAILFLLGVGLGVSLYHAAFGFSGSWRRFINKRRGEGIRAQLLLAALVSLLFFPLLGQVIPGVQVSPALGQVGVSVMVGAFLFGIGMQLGGGCGSGTLYTVGGGHVNMLVTLLFFIVGSFLGSVHLPWWLSLPNLGKVSVIQSLGWLPALLLQLLVLGALFALVRQLERRRNGNVLSLTSGGRDNGFYDRLIFGPWPLWWGTIGLGLFSALTFWFAGHPWSITFAFGLWGAKIWSALGGDVASLSYWGSGYPARALNQSVLADTTSLMDFGLILGAVLAAALAGKFAPDKKVTVHLLLASVLGGLLLGYGARLAFGCNIGGLLAGISTGSVHGWLWLVAGFAGNMVGVRLRGLFQLDAAAGVR